MPAQWTGDLVRKMHMKRITKSELAGKLSVSEAWVSMVLNGKRDPAGAEERFKQALDELLKGKEEA